MWLLGSLSSRSQLSSRPGSSVADYSSSAASSGIAPMGWCKEAYLSEIESGHAWNLPEWPDSKDPPPLPSRPD